jgi:hypothetical protein
VPYEEKVHRKHAAPPHGKNSTSGGLVIRLDPGANRTYFYGRARARRALRGDPREKLFEMRRLTALRASVVAPALLFSACSTAQLSRICQNAGGRYTNEGCDASTPAQKAARDWCETHGGVYLGGQGHCVFGGGGP